MLVCGTSHSERPCEPSNIRDYLHPKALQKCRADRAELGPPPSDRSSTRRAGSICAIARRERHQTIDAFAFVVLRDSRSSGPRPRVRMADEQKRKSRAALEKGEIGSLRILTRRPDGPDVALLSRNSATRTRAGPLAAGRRLVACDALSRFSPMKGPPYGSIVCCRRRDIAARRLRAFRAVSAQVLAESPTGHPGISVSA